MLGNFIGQFLGLFQNLLIRTKFRIAHKNLISLFMSIIIDFRLFFKENAGLSTDVDSTWVAFNSILINVLCWDLSLLVKKTRREWETMSTPDLVNLANQLSHIFDESHKRKNSKILNLQLLQMQLLNKTKPS